jgi:16S rRNA (cytosine967-C5)-methyltransferase
MENETIVADFLSQHPEAKECPITAEWGRACLHGRQSLPHIDPMDGFYYALLEKCG